MNNDFKLLTLIFGCVLFLSAYADRNENNDTPPKENQDNKDTSDRGLPLAEAIDYAIKYMDAMPWDPYPPRPE